MLPARPEQQDLPTGYTLAAHANDSYAARLQRNLSSYVTPECLVHTGLPLAACAIGATFTGLTIAGLSGHGPFALTAAQMASWGTINTNGLGKSIALCLGACASGCVTASATMQVVGDTWGRREDLIRVITTPFTAPQQQTMVRAIVANPDGGIQLAQSSPPASA